MFNGTCLRGFTYKKYLCVCQDGYWGENCERGEAYCACYTRLSFVRHSGEISEHACNAREILGVQRNGNDSISSVTEENNIQPSNHIKTTFYDSFAYLFSANFINSYQNFKGEYSLNNEKFQKLLS